MPNIYPGKMVLYRWRSGQVRAGQADAAAMVTRIHTDGTLDLTVYPAMDRDALFQDRVMQMSDTVHGHCWHFTPDDDRIAELEAQVAALSGETAKPKRKAA